MAGSRAQSIDSMKFLPMTLLERRAVGGLATVMATRLLGLFLILPVFALYAERLDGHTPFLVGMALGVYGLTQALLQIPFGMLSDRFGRKPVILAGLCLFAAGSVTAALAHSITWVIVGRVMQGAGAISAAVVAMVADLTRETQRTKAMAIIGMTIGASFFLSLLLGPLLGGWIDVNGIFWFTAGLAMLGMVVTQWVVPAADVIRASQLGVGAIVNIVRDRTLLRLNIGIFALHATLTALFVAVPVALVRNAHLPVASHWHIYLPTLAASVVALVPMIFFAERRGYMRTVFVSAIVLLVASQIFFWFEAQSLAGLTVGILLFFMGFNFLEAVLPSLISRHVDARTKGTAIGVYSSFQFFGAFFGGATGGWVAGRYGMTAVFILNAVVTLFWLAVALRMPALPATRTYLLRLADAERADTKRLVEEIAGVGGVRDATAVPEEGVVYVRVDEKTLDRDALARFGQYT